MSVTRKLAFATVALLLLGLGAELLARTVFYQLRSEHSLAVVDGFVQAREGLAAARRRELIESARDDARLYHGAQTELESEAGTELRAELQARYEAEFVKLRDAVAAADSIFLVLDFLHGAPTSFGRFIADLASRHGVRHLDLSAAIRGLPPEFIHLQPADGHLTRAANLLIVRELAERLAELQDHRSSRDYAGDPVILGDLFKQLGGRGGRRRLMGTHPQLGFRLLINRHGLRGTTDLDIPKRRQRILALGDSFTFGPHLDNQDTWPALLEWQHPELEVLNAGVSGYTITDQRELFERRARHAAPDVTILQVCNNDLIGLTAFLGNRFARSGAGSLVPSPAERRFLARLRAADATEQAPR